MSARRALAGGIIVMALAAAAMVAARGGRGDPSPQLKLIGLSAATFVAAAIISRARPWIVPATVTAVSAALALRWHRDLFSRAPLGGPFRYANADGSFYAVAAIAGLMVVATGRNLPARFAGAASAAFFAAAAVGSGSRAATVVGLGLPVVAAVAISRTTPRAAVRTMAGLFGLALLASVAVGLRGTPSTHPTSVDRAIASAISARRVTLWHEALTMMSRHPADGVGPGRFRYASATARADPDAGWAHDEFLQEGAEAGAPGMVALLLLFAWLFESIAVRGRPDGVMVLGAAAVAALGIHACVDYVMHFAGIPVTVAALAGTAVVRVRRGRESNRGSQAADAVLAEAT